MKISVVINTYNAEKHLERVLESVKNFDEILICDMYSTDRTLEIARKYGCKIVYHKKESFVEPARDFAIHSATHDWVLVLDADELATPALREYLYQIINRIPQLGGVRIPVKNFLMGHFMHSAYPNYVARFFKKEATYWPPYVHVQPEIKGTVITIPRNRKELALIHLSNDSVATNVRKINQYSEGELEKRKGKHYSIPALIGAMTFRFFKLYILKGGIRDGKAGFVSCALSSFYKFVSVAKLWEAQNQYQDMEKEISKNSRP